MKIFICMAIVLACSACVTNESVVKERAAYDFKCQDEVQVKRITMGTYEATGCDKQGLYNCISTGVNGNTPSCIREN